MYQTSIYYVELSSQESSQFWGVSHGLKQMMSYMSGINEVIKSAKTLINIEVKE